MRTEPTTAALFDAPPPRFDARVPVLRRINRFTADRWFAEHHYIGTCGNAQVGVFGLYAPDMMAAVAVGNAGNVAGVASRYGLERWRGNVEITRVAAHPDAPPNTASRVIAAVCRQLARERWDWVFSYADTAQGHHGGIYQALNAMYVGLNETEPRAGYLLDGVPIHPRSVVADAGTQAWPACRDIYAMRGRTLVRVDDAIAPKHTYILVVSSNGRTRHAIRRQLRPHALPYPKRDGHVRGRPLGTDPDHRSGTAGPNPAPRSTEVSI